jgi:hypothetical protein
LQTQSRLIYEQRLMMLASVRLLQRLRSVALRGLADLGYAES